MTKPTKRFLGFVGVAAVLLLLPSKGFAEPDNNVSDGESLEQISPALVPRVRHFSPNLDGVKDTLNIPLSIKDPSRLKAWQIHIGEARQGKFHTIRTIRSEPPREIVKMTPAKFWKKLFSAKEKIVVPQVVRWNGEVSSELAFGRKGSTLAKDGVYHIQIDAADEYGNTTTTKFIPVVLDTKAPELRLASEEAIFSPNADGRKETIAFTIEPLQTAKPYDRFSYALTDSQGNVHAEREGSIDALMGRESKPFTFVWKGTTKGGKPSPEGAYNFVLKANDLAGNEFTEGVENILLVRAYETASLKLSSEQLSPDNNGLFDQVVFTVGFSSTQHMDSWKIVVSDEKNSPVHEIEGSENELGSVPYGGLLASEGILPEGRYQAQLIGDFASGNQPTSETVRFVVDVTPPPIEVVVRQKYFLPNEKNAPNRALTIEHKAPEAATYRGFIKDEYGNIVLIREVEGTLPKTFDWDGTNMQGAIVPGRYTYTLVGEDKAGNSSEVSSASFELVTQKAAIGVRSRRLSFSPNADGKADDMSFLFDANKKERITSTTLVVYNEKKEPIKTLTARGYKEEIIWKGTDQDNKIVPEGKYFYTGSYVMGSGEEPTSDPKPIYVDLTPIAIELGLRSTLFSPNADGRKDFLFIDQVKKKSAILDQMDEVRLTIIDAKKTVHRSLEWTGTPPEGTKWNGLNDNGKPVPEGNNYRYVLSTTDHAGNSKTYTSESFGLVRQPPTLSLSLSGLHLTYEATPYAVRGLRIVPAVAHKSPAKDLLLRLTYKLKSSGQGSDDTFPIHESKEIAPFDWNGRTLSKERLPNGRYSLYAQLEYDSGNRASAVAPNLVVDTEAPRIQLRSQPEYFSPDGDGKGEQLHIRVEIDEPNTLRQSKAVLYRKVFMRNKKLFEQSFSNYQAQGRKPFMSWDLGSQPNTLLKWNGKSSDGKQLVESANDYMFFVEAVDAAGNVSIEGILIQVDVLVETLADGRLRIILNSLNFVFDSTKLIGDYQKTLDRLVYILYKFPKYKIHLIGHTDSQGTDPYNQTLSEDRAEVVYKYLRREGISTERMTWEGRGETELLDLQGVADVEEIHRRNRRVEIYLKRDGE